MGTARRARRVIALTTVAFCTAMPAAGTCSDRECIAPDSDPFLLQVRVDVQDDTGGMIPNLEDIPTVDDLIEYVNSNIDNLVNRLNGFIDNKGEQAKDQLEVAVTIGAESYLAFTRPMMLALNGLIGVAEIGVQALADQTDATIERLADENDGCVYRDFHLALRNFEETVNTQMTRFLVNYGKVRQGLETFGHRTSDSLKYMAENVEPWLLKTKAVVTGKLDDGLAQTAKFEDRVTASAVAITGLTRATNAVIVEKLESFNGLLREMATEASRIVQVLESTVEDIAASIQGASNATKNEQVDSLLSEIRGKSSRTLGTFKATVDHLVARMTGTSKLLIEAATEKLKLER